MPEVSGKAKERRQLAYEAVTPAQWNQRFQGLEALEQFQLGVVAQMTARRPDDPPRVVLEVGCGTGRMVALYPGERYVGMDRASHFVQFCQSHRSTDDSQFLLADMDHLPFSKGAFDLILLMGTLESETNVLERVDALIFYLRSGGQLFFTLQNRRNLFGRVGNAFSRSYKQTFWGHRQLVELLARRYYHPKMVSVFVVPPGVMRLLTRSTAWLPGLRRFIVGAFLALEWVNLRYQLKLGYEWQILLRRPVHPRPTTNR
ncbi:MAG: class I SAM-dependent methyltransferase [Chloroflexi bacterium]|nr:class I SAM-dependent methyltransferase [Chloroflexota bacterium]